jgi:hypothetical protein
VEVKDVNLNVVKLQEKQITVRAEVRGVLNAKVQQETKVIFVTEVVILDWIDSRSGWSTDTVF